MGVSRNQSDFENESPSTPSLSDNPDYVPLVPTQVINAIPVLRSASDASSKSVPANRRKTSVVVGSNNRSIELSTPWQTLLNDAFLSNAPRMVLEGREVPALGGMPLISKLGQGGMGAVYLGIHCGLAREVAVKVLPFHLAQTRPELVKRFFREARIAANINSEHLVRVTDVAQEGTLSYLVMEFVAGKSAAGLLKDKIFSGVSGLEEAAALDICIATCKGLAAAHAANIVHRDIKPDNILVPLGADKKSFAYAAAKLADLGLARFDEENHSMTGAESCLGTPGYMAPEQIVDSRTGGKPADVFGLGATLYALLCGSAPFSGDTAMKAMWSTLDEAHSPIRAARTAVSKSTAEVIDICLAKEPEHRYANGAALLKALEACRKAMRNPQDVDYAEINQPRLDRERVRPPTAIISQPPLVSAPAASSALTTRTALALAIFFAALTGIAGYYFATSAADRPRSTALDSLPSPKKLDESESRSDAQIRQEEIGRKLAIEAFNRKRESLELADFEDALAQTRDAVAKSNWANARQFLERAERSPGLQLSPKRTDLIGLREAVKQGLRGGK
jgi:serine/threonine protein kinase